jgi:carboxymethylenebutenolidase
MVGQDISIVCENGEIPAYFSEPKVGNGPGVIIISAIFGVDDDTKKMCDKLAESGHPAMALNMFWKDEIDSGPLLLENYDRAIARAQRVDRKSGNAYIRASIDKLKSASSCDGKVAVFGFCYGGPYAVEAAAHLGVDGAISFHGSYIEKFLEEFKNINCPIDFHFGDNDNVAPMDVIRLVEAECSKLEDANVFVYSGGAHGYMFPNRGDGYHAKAAELSWDRAIEFLKKI